MSSERENGFVPEAEAEVTEYRDACRHLREVTDAEFEVRHGEVARAEAGAETLPIYPRDPLPDNSRFRRGGLGNLYRYPSGEVAIEIFDGRNLFIDYRLEEQELRKTWLVLGSNALAGLASFAGSQKVGAEEARGLARMISEGPQGPPRRGRRIPRLLPRPRPTRPSIQGT